MRKPIGNISQNNATFIFERRSTKRPLHIFIFDEKYSSIFHKNGPISLQVLTLLILQTAIHLEMTRLLFHTLSVR